jgi:hypothetical protein
MDGDQIVKNQDLPPDRGLHLGNRRGNSKKGGGGLKVLFFHYVPQSTVQLQSLPSEAVNESACLHIKRLFGVWIESGDEDKQLEELYQSRLVPSSMLDEDG